jgi:hypothetical protein
VVSPKFLELGVWVRVLAVHFFLRGVVAAWVGSDAGIRSSVAERGVGEPVGECGGMPRVSACSQSSS